MRARDFNPLGDLTPREIPKLHCIRRSVIIGSPIRAANDRWLDATSRKGGNATLSSQENELPPTPSSAPNPRSAFRVVTSFRVSTLGVAFAICVIILLLLTVAVYAGFNAVLRPLVTLLGIAAAFAGLASRGRIRVRSRRTAATPDDIRDLPDDIRAMLPEGAKKVYDLNELPPSLANNPEVQRLFERAGARGAWVKIDSPARSSAAVSEGATGQGESAVSSGRGDVPPVRVKRVTRISFRASAASDAHSQSSDTAPDAAAANAMSRKLEPAAFGPGVTSFLSSAVTWAAFLLIFAALAAAAVAWMSLKAGSSAH